MEIASTMRSFVAFHVALSLQRAIFRKVQAHDDPPALSRAERMFDSVRKCRLQVFDRDRVLAQGLPPMLDPIYSYGSAGSVHHRVEVEDVFSIV